MATAIAADQTRVVPVRVWDLPTRVFHWLFATSFVGAYVTGDADAFRNLHLMFGYTVAGLIVFRLLWGLVGTRYARFASFLFPPGEVLAYLRSLLTPSPRHYLGHNPAGALAIFLLLLVATTTAGSGYLHNREVGGHWLEELHEGAATFMLALVAVHVAGVVVSSLLHRENLVRAMFTGNKRGDPSAGIARRTVVAGLLLAAVLAYWTADLNAWTSNPGAAAEQRQGKLGRQDHDD